MQQPPEAPAPPSSPEPAASTARNARARPRIDLKALGSNWRLVTTLGLLGCGVVFVMLGWYGAANTNIITEQVPYLISGGLLGLGLIIVAGIMAASAASDREVAELRREIARIASSAGGTNGSVATSPHVAMNGSRVFTLPGGRSYHEPGCPILEGKDGIEELQPATAAGAGLAPCKLCAAD